MEVWKDIEGYEGLYQVSNKGRVKSLERTVWTGRGYYQTLPERILKPCKDSRGYLYVNLCKEGKRKTCRIHRLVAQAFIDNPDNLPEVNHIDEDKENNAIENLEWCTSKDNINFGTHNQRMAEKKSKPVIGIHKITGLILEFSSTHEAERQTGIAQGNICRCCNRKYKSAGGYYWMYAE